MKRIGLIILVWASISISFATGIEQFYCLTSNTSSLSLFWEVQCSDAHRVFILERSFDKEHFVRIAQIEEDKEGEASTSCSFTDTPPHEGWVYYRLTIVDNTGVHTKTITSFVGEVA